MEEVLDLGFSKNEPLPSEGDEVVMNGLQGRYRVKILQVHSKRVQPETEMTFLEVSAVREHIGPPQPE